LRLSCRGCTKLGHFVNGALISVPDTSSPISSVASQPPPSNPEILIKDVLDKESSVDSPESPHQPVPAATVKQYQFFGEDPSEYPDDTIYEIRSVTSDMTEQEKKAIYSVAEYPASDLHDLTPGTPPDRDFSNAKPTNQVAAATFSNYVEPYLRPLTEEDRAFLLERVWLAPFACMFPLIFYRVIGRDAWKFLNVAQNITSSCGMKKMEMIQNQRAATSSLRAKLEVA
jgi:transcriptional adapter 3